MTTDLKQKRLELGYTQEELAFNADVSVRTLYDVENYKRKVKKDTFEKIVNELGVSKSYEQHMMNVNSNQVDLILGLRELDNTNPLVIKGELREKLLKAPDLLKEQNFREALDIYLLCSKLFTNECCYLLGCAMIYGMLEEYDKAIEYCDKILSMDKYKYDALYIKGTSLGALEDYSTSIEVLTHALEFNETSELFYNIGVAYHMIGDKSSAIIYYDKCLDMNTDFASAHLNIGICYFKSWDYEKSLYHLEKAIELKPNMYQAYASLGEYYKDLGEHTKAITYFNKCLEYDKDNYQALLGLFMSLAVIGNTSESKIYYKRFFELYSDIFFDKNKNNDKAIKHKSEYIFIGAPEISDGTGSIQYPIIGKFFQNKSKFDETVAKVKDSTSLFQYSDKPIYIEFNNDIKVNVVGLENDILIEIVFGSEYKIIEINICSEELESFIDLFNKYGQFRIHLECGSEIFIIDCLKNISFKM